jgi:DNA-binding HxlR family transcriptional regulator
LPRKNREPTSPARLASLAALTHYRWAIPAVAECHGSPWGGHKYVTFLHRLGISRDSLGRTLASLVEQGFIATPTGAGHPLRPEYLLSPSGKRIAPACAGVVKELRRLGEESIGLQKWSLPVLAALGDGPRRFGDLRGALVEATPRALSMSLRGLEEQGMIRRSVKDTYPPTTDYTLSRKALRLAAATRRLVAALGLRVPASREDPKQTQRRRRKAG